MVTALILVFIFGTIIGSFLNVLIFRLPAEESINGRSQCRSCKHKLDVADLVPVLSFLYLKGRCRYCKDRVSWQYISVEVITGLLFTLGYYMVFKDAGYSSFSLGLDYFRMIFVISVLIVVFMIDLKHFLILDRVIFPATFLLFLIDWSIYWIGSGDILESVPVTGVLSGLIAFIFFGLIYLLSRGRWLGLGDVKFVWFLGLAVPWPLIFVNIFLAFGIGAVVGIFLLLTKTKKLSSQIAFGTFLSASCIIAMFWGQQIFSWYLNLIGFHS